MVKNVLIIFFTSLRLAGMSRKAGHTFTSANPAITLARWFALWGLKFSILQLGQLEMVPIPDGGEQGAGKRLLDQGNPDCS